MWIGIWVPVPEVVQAAALWVWWTFVPAFVRRELTRLPPLTGGLFSNERGGEMVRVSTWLRSDGDVMHSVPLDMQLRPFWLQSDMQIAAAYRVLGAAKARAPPGSPQLLLNAVDDFLWNTSGQMCVGDVKVRLKQARCKAERHQMAAFHLLVLQGLILDEVIARCRPKVGLCMQQSQWPGIVLLSADNVLVCAAPAAACLASRRLFADDLFSKESTCLLTGCCPCSLPWNLAAS